jgi:DNA-binding XRE family transcriptional regulator
VGRRKMIADSSDFEFSSRIIEQDYVPILINNVQKIREALKINQATVSNYLQKSRKIYGDNEDLYIEGKKEVISTHQRMGLVERGETVPTVLTALRISDILGVNINEIYRIVYLRNEDYIKLLNNKYDKKINKIVAVPEVEDIKEKIKEEFDKLSKNDSSSYDSRELMLLKRDLTRARNKYCIIKNGNAILGNIWENIKEGIEFLEPQTLSKAKSARG